MSKWIRATYMRGGTSKGLFFHASDLPAAGPERDALLLRIMGSPDPLQIDGMGGTTSSTSKVVVVEPGPAGSVNYLFGQVATTEALIDWSGNCGNLTTAVAPFALTEGIISAPQEATAATFALLNLNTGVQIEADLQLVNGMPAETGDFAIAGVPGTAAPITTRYLNPAGAVLGSLLPLGEAVSVFKTSFGEIAGSLVDATNPYLFVRAADVLPATVDATAAAQDISTAIATDQEFLARVEELRSTCAVAAGVAPTPQEALLKAPTVPRVVLVSADNRGEADISTLTFAMGKLHRGIPMTAALALAAARTVPGSLVAEIAGPKTARLISTVIAHPLGTTTVAATTSAATTSAATLTSVGVTRTARVLMRGEVQA